MHEPLMLEIRRSVPPWHCAIHGTVSECPLRYLWCTDDLPDIVQERADQDRAYRTDSNTTIAHWRIEDE
jgi:hypothetical protein